MIGIVWAVVLGVSILFWPISVEDKRALLKLWFIRCLVALGVMLFYENIYPLDAFQYFVDSTQISAPLSDVAFGNGTANFSALAWILNHVMPLNDSYHALKVVLSMIGLIATYLFYRGAVRFTGKADIRFLYLLGLFPSLLFWSSILGKDPISYFGIALYFYAVLSWLGTNQFKYLALLAVGVVCACFIRTWLGVVLLIPLLALVGLKMQSRVMRLVLFLVGIGSTIMMAKILGEQFGFENADTLVSSTNQIAHSWGAGGSGQAAPDFQTPWQLLKFAPVGMFTALFRPLPGEVNNIFGLLAGLENLALLGLAIIALKKMKLSLLRVPAIAWGLSMIVVWSFLYAFVSYQNLGSAVRFKLQILPVLISLLVYIINYKKLSCAESPES
jgi:hypothetical protein